MKGARVEMHDGSFVVCSIPNLVYIYTVNYFQKKY